jgi:thiol-disulfide isomerase/thioredoxin
MFNAFRIVMFSAVAIAGVFYVASEPVEVEVWSATWCGPCRDLKAFLKSDHPDLAKMTVVVRDFDENRREATKRKVGAVPTTIVKYRGNEVGRVIGFASVQAWLKAVREAAE